MSAKRQRADADDLSSSPPPPSSPRVWPMALFRHMAQWLQLEDVARLGSVCCEWNRRVVQVQSTTTEVTLELDTCRQHRTLLNRHPVHVQTVMRLATGVRKLTISGSVGYAAWPHRRASTHALRMLSGGFALTALDILHMVSHERLGDALASPLPLRELRLVRATASTLEHHHLLPQHEAMLAISQQTLEIVQCGFNPNGPTCWLPVLQMPKLRELHLVVSEFADELGIRTCKALVMLSDTARFPALERVRMHVDSRDSRSANQRVLQAVVATAIQLLDARTTTTAAVAVLDEFALEMGGLQTIAMNVRTRTVVYHIAHVDALRDDCCALALLQHFPRAVKACATLRIALPGSFESSSYHNVVGVLRASDLRPTTLQILGHAAFVRLVMREVATVTAASTVEVFCPRPVHMRTLLEHCQFATLVKQSQQFLLPTEAWPSSF